jgi:hypothetical protein
MVRLTKGFKLLARINAGKFAHFPALVIETLNAVRARSTQIWSIWPAHAPNQKLKACQINHKKCEVL